MSSNLIFVLIHMDFTTAFYFSLITYIYKVKTVSVLLQNQPTAKENLIKTIVKSVGLVYYFKYYIYVDLWDRTLSL